MATGANLVTYVGAKLGITPSASTYPTNTQIGFWLNDGQYELIRQLDPLLIPSLVVELSPTTAAAAVRTNLAADFFKNIAAYNSLDSEPCKLISYTEYVEIKSGAHSYLTTSSYVYTIGFSTATSWLYFPSTDPTNMNFLYIKYPQAIASPPSTEVFSLLDELIPYVVDYAVIQAKTQDEEEPTRDKLLDDWNKRIQILNKSAK